MKPKQTKTRRIRLSLGELVMAVNSCSHNSREAIAAIVDLIESGRVRIESLGRPLRAHVC